MTTFFRRMINVVFQTSIYGTSLNICLKDGILHFTPVVSFFELVGEISVGTYIYVEKDALEMLFAECDRT